MFNDILAKSHCGRLFEPSSAQTLPWAADDSVWQFISLLNEICTGKHFGEEWLAKPEGPKTLNSDICLFPLVAERTTSQNTCVSSVCNLRTFDTGPILSHSCSLFVHHLVPNLKSTSQRFFKSIVSECYYAFFMGCKSTHRNLQYHFSNFKIELLADGVYLFSWEPILIIEMKSYQMDYWNCSLRGVWDSEYLYTMWAFATENPDGR